MAEVTCTATAPVNIAVIKYWGKRDTKLLLPTNASLSVTIDPDTMCSRTTITASPAFAANTMSLNGKEEDFDGNVRLCNVVREMRKIAGDYVGADGAVVVKKEDWATYKLKVVSHNNFPTAAGLASSASGYACFTKCLAEVFAAKEEFEGQLTTISRQGSGSSCRSLFGGYAEWRVGSKEDGTDSIAAEVAPRSHWPEMRALILVARATAKDVGSTTGMQRTLATSPLLQARIEGVEARMTAMTKHIMARDFAEFGKLTMIDSNQFHATCLDTYPPIFYLNETSRMVIQTVHKVNAHFDRIVCAYTFDAGPNAVVYVLADDMNAVLDVMLHYYMPADADSVAGWIHDPLHLSPYKGDDKATPPPAEVVAACGAVNADARISQIIVSQVGDGAKVTERKP